MVWLIKEILQEKYAALRGIYDYGKPFKREAPGSQKQYGFCIPTMQLGTTVAVFEAAIDAMQRCYDAMNDDFQTQLVISYLFEACHVINTALDHKE